MSRTEARLPGTIKICVLLGLAGWLGGCATPLKLPPVPQDVTQARPDESRLVSVGYPSTDAAAASGYAPYTPSAYAEQNPPGAPPTGFPAAGGPPAGPMTPPTGYPPAGYPQPVDRSVVPMGATDVAPAFATGPNVSSYSTAPSNAPPGPPAYGPGAPPPYGPAASPAYGPAGPVGSGPVPAPVPSPVAQPAPGGPVLGPDDKPKEAASGWDRLAPDNIWKDIKQSFGYGPDEKIARQSFDEGMVLFHAKKYDEAAEKFYITTWRWPDSSLEEDAMFFLGESNFFADRYGKADDAYANLLKQHDNSRYLDTVMSRFFAIARYWELVDAKDHQWPIAPNTTDKTRPWFDTAGNGFAAYEMVRLHDPTGPLADAAVMSVANWHFRRGEWVDAADNYDLLRKDYPRSKFQKDAHLLGLQAKLHIYQGPRYDVGPLNDAKEIADQTLTQFHGRLGPEEARLVETRAQITEKKAAREFEMAQFYDSKKQYGAARYYYRGAISRYPHSAVAEKSRVRLQEIKNEPDNPPKLFTWLTGLFEPTKPNEVEQQSSESEQLKNMVEGPQQQRERQTGQPTFGQPN